MESKKVKKTIVSYGHDLTEVLADRFSSLEEFAANEPTYAGTAIAMGELGWLMGRYSHEASHAQENENSHVKDRIRPGRRDGGDRVIADSDVETIAHTIRSTRKKSDRSNGRGPKVYDYVDQPFALSADNAASLRKPGEVTMKVHVPMDSNIVPVFFNTDAKNIGKNRDAKAARDMLSSSRRKYVGWLRDCDVKVNSAKVSVCRAFKNKRHV